MEHRLLKRLQDHKYSAQGASICEPFMQIFWNWFIQFVPMWIAPNLLTIIGLFLNVSSTIVLLLYSLDAKAEVPSFACFIAALCLFIYQTLDAIDGKQARRTNSSSTLGELFDHGCDSVSAMFIALGFGVAMGFGHHLWMLFLNVLIAQSLFYFAHWQCYVTGFLQFSKLDVTEVQFFVIFIYLLTALFGVKFWSKEIPGIRMQIKLTEILFQIVFACVISMRFILTIIRKGSGKNGTTVANTSILFPIFPVAFVFGTALYSATRSYSHVYEQNPCLFLLTYGCVVCKLTNKLIIAHMTKSEIHFMDSIYFGPFLIFVNQFFNCLFNEKFILWIAFVYCAYSVTQHFIDVCHQIADHLNIYIFSLEARPKLELSSSYSSDTDDSFSE